MTKKLAVCYVVLEVSSVISVYVSVHSVVHMNINIIDRTHTHTPYSSKALKTLNGLGAI